MRIYKKVEFIAKFNIIFNSSARLEGLKAKNRNGEERNKRRLDGQKHR
jgi:hypothetical protein